MTLIVATPFAEQQMADVRCPCCARLLLRGVFIGEIEIRCGKCNYLAKCQGVMQ